MGRKCPPLICRPGKSKPVKPYFSVVPPTNDDGSIDFDGLERLERMAGRSFAEPFAEQEEEGGDGL